MKKYNTGITFGVFDGITSAHLEVLKQAKKQCYKLIVCVSSDRYVLRTKGKMPIMNEIMRMAVISSLPFIDAVHFQSDIFNKKLNIKLFKPDVIFVGAEYKNKDWEGKELGISVEYIEHNHTIHSSHLR
ncbi:MAG: adenylyltransferase/cytidyltransferase family protein [Candidatus Paceibacterota bacterium]